MSDWVYMTHPATGGSTRVPDVPDVVASHESRGWAVADEPAPAPVVPVGGTSSGDDGWVTLVHPATGGTQRLPDHPDALAGAFDAGWTYPPDPLAGVVIPLPPEPSPAPAEPTPDTEE